MLITNIAISSLIGKIIFGMGADKFNLKYSLMTAQLLVVIALVMLSLEPAFQWMWPPPWYWALPLVVFYRCRERWSPRCLGYSAIAESWA